jgi:hypothetical protein
MTGAPGVGVMNEWLWVRKGTRMLEKSCMLMGSLSAFGALCVRLFGAALVLVRLACASRVWLGGRCGSGFRGD